MCVSVTARSGGGQGLMALTYKNGLSNNWSGAIGVGASPPVSRHPRAGWARRPHECHATYTVQPTRPSMSDNQTLSAVEHGLDGPRSRFVSKSLV
ncbi:hypothetical protein NLI96_g3442 [Meripilus lineatus]|uniref:Uncharacterized protein n=1 Tax=Meripilus lineatus TaxID=2056292 RepID=A0AAD5V6P7_9APHY|nr:hypothetical protein NLI96_g3442 [Physisporinus lineatus]